MRNEQLSGCPENGKTGKTEGGGFYI